MNLHNFISENSTDSELNDDELKFLQKLQDETQLLSEMYDKVAIERFTESKNNFFSRIYQIQSNPRYLSFMLL